MPVAPQQQFAAIGVAEHEQHFDRETHIGSAIRLATESGRPVKQISIAKTAVRSTILRIIAWGWPKRAGTFLLCRNFSNSARLNRTVAVLPVPYFS
jgi:hypothetical protein